MTASTANKMGNSSDRTVRRFNRDFYDPSDTFTVIGNGQMGGKAAGLAFIKEHVTMSPDILPETVTQQKKGLEIALDIPRLTVITTTFFDRFMKENDLYGTALSDQSDEAITRRFLKAELPAELVGDLRGLIAKVRAPLAVRSSSLLEDRLEAPFAGVYGTKMIPNNQPDIETRFRKLTEAVKFVYASTFSKSAKSYIRTTAHRIEEEKMAVIIQEIVGLRHYDRFYPDISGVCKSYNFYPTGHAAPEDGVAALALGLGKSIVDGSRVWNYSPAYPHASPPYSNVNQLLKESQLHFWAVDMGQLPKYDPLKESEYLVKSCLKHAEYDNALRFTASTYDYHADRIHIGTGIKGPHILNFAPLLQTELMPLNDMVKLVMKRCEEVCNAKVEIEFAVTIDQTKGNRFRFGLLQVRPMAVSDEVVDLDDEYTEDREILTASEDVMGNGTEESIWDIVYVKPETFDLKHSKIIAWDIADLNSELVKQGTPYLLIGFGRWGTSDPWLGIPAEWGQISGARVIVETQLKNRSIELSQGSHFFHNISNLGVFYFSVKSSGPSPVDWKWLDQQTVLHDGEFIRHVRLNSPLTVKVDGRKRQGVIFK
jgi:hypothetical protein